MRKFVDWILEGIGVRFAKIDVMHSGDLYFVQMHDKFLCDRLGALITFVSSVDAQEAGRYFWNSKSNPIFHRSEFEAWQLLAQPLGSSFPIEWTP